MTDKSNALQLADLIDYRYVNWLDEDKNGFADVQAAKELRRLHAENEKLRSGEQAAVITALEEALQSCISDLEHEESDGWMSGQVHFDSYRKALAALARAKEGGRV